jgi:NAD(P)-dependent dehydrogenase (short-subunit alcohol dehydrogenase family)
MKLGSDLPTPSQGDGMSAPPPGLGCLKPFGAVLAIAVAFAAAGAGVLVGRCSSKPATPAATSVSVLRPGPNVIVAVRDLAQLTSAEYQVERVIDLTEQQTRFFGLLKARDALLLVAAGSVAAGVDLSELREADVRVDEAKKSVHIRLPPPKILSSRLDNERTYVHTRRTDVLAERKESLETRARQEAERAIVEAARQGGILERAKHNAQRTVEALVRSLGYDSVTVEVRPAE